MSRQIASSSLRHGMKLGRSLYDEKGRVLLAKGVKVKDGYIPKIQSDFAVVYVDDELSEGIEIKEVIPLEWRLETQSILAEQWNVWRHRENSEQLYVNRKLVKSLRNQIKDLIYVLQGTAILQEDLTTIATYDSQAYVHAINVAIYSLFIGLSLGYSQSMLVDLGLGAILHDIGEIFVPESILDKPGILLPEEYEEMKKHAEIGHKILARQHELSYFVAHCAFQHHERLDGSGYPRGLKGDSIHSFAKIIAVADVFDALVMDRPQRRGMLPADAMEYLYSRVDVEYDMTIVAMMSRRVSIYPIGMEVKLSDGSVAIIKDANPNFPTRPIVRIIKNEKGEEIKPKEINLIEHLSLTIVHTHDKFDNELGMLLEISNA